MQNEVFAAILNLTIKIKSFGGKDDPPAPRPIPIGCRSDRLREMWLASGGRTALKLGERLPYFGIGIKRNKTPFLNRGAI